MRPRTALLLFLSASCAPSTSSPPPSSPPPPFRVMENRIVDAHDRTVILRGANVAGSHKFAPYLGYHREEDFQAIRTSLGMNSIRFLMTWAAVEPQRGIYDDTYLDEVRLRLDWAHDAGLLVILDMHQDVYGEGFSGGDGAPRWTCDESRYAAFQPQSQWYLNYLDENVTACFDALWTDPALQDAFANMWAHVAERFSDHPAVLGFDVINEPFIGSFSVENFDAQVLQPLYEHVVPLVRVHAPHWLAFLEPSGMRNLGFATRLAPFPFDGVVYAPHAYDSGAEQGMGFPADRAALLTSTIASLDEESRAMHAALWFGEYGGNADHAGIGAYMDTVLDGAAAHLAGTAYWAHGRGDHGYDLYNSDGSEKAELLDHVARPSPSRIAGAISAWSFDVVTRRFHLAFTASASDAPSTISIPDRTWPAGHRVTISGAVSTENDGTLELTAEPGARVDVVIEPG